MAPETGALLRHIILNALRLDIASTRSIKNRHTKAALTPAYRLEALMGFRHDSAN